MSNYPNLTDPMEDFAITIFRINALLMANGERLTRSLGQSSARWHILGQIEFESQTVATVARNMGQARQSAQRVADSLVNDGLMQYVDHPTDKRTKLMILTGKGKDAIHQINQANTQWIKETTPNIGKQKLIEVNKNLKDIALVIEQNQ